MKKIENPNTIPNNPLTKPIWRTNFGHRDTLWNNHLSLSLSRCTGCGTVDSEVNFNEVDDIEIADSVKPTVKLKIADGMYYQYNGKMPNWFHKAMQYLIFGFEYEKLDK